MHSYFKNHTLAAGALLLTPTGIASRILGFFYRIFLSRTIGAEGLGVYQMVFPIYGICFSICAGSIQTAISRFTAADRDRAGRTLLAGFIISFSLALGLAAVIIRFSGFLASQVLMEPRCAPLLPTMALAIPCTSVHACLCGWYYGKEKVQVPALSQMVEQCIRIFTVFLIARIWEDRGRPVTVLAAVAGLVAGEAGSALFTLLSFLLFGNRKKDGPSVSGRPAPSSVLTAAAPAPGHGPAPHGQPAGHEPSPEPGGHSDPRPPGAFRPFPVPGLKRLRRPHGNGPALCHVPLGHHKLSGSGPPAFGGPSPVPGKPLRDPEKYRPVLPVQLLYGDPVHRDLHIL